MAVYIYIHEALSAAGICLLAAALASANGNGDPQGSCVATTLEIDGRAVVPVRVELRVAGASITPRQCREGFIVPAEAGQNDRVGVRVLGAGRAVDLGELSSAQVTKVEAWQVIVDTPPFVPGRWGAPEDVAEIRAIGFMPLTGDGTAISIYNHVPGTHRRNRLGSLLSRVDLIHEGVWLCLPRGERWHLGSAVSLTTGVTGSEEPLRCESDGFVAVMSADRLKSVATEILSDHPDADVALLLEGMMREYCAHTGSERKQCKQYSQPKAGPLLPK